MLSIIHKYILYMKRETCSIIWSYYTILLAKLFRNIEFFRIRSTSTTTAMMMEKKNIFVRRIKENKREKERVRAIDSSPSLRESGPPITPASLGPGWPESAPSWHQRLEQQVTANYTPTFCPWRRVGGKTRRNLPKDSRKIFEIYESTSEVPIDSKSTWY